MSRDGAPATTMAGGPGTGSSVERGDSGMAYGPVDVVIIGFPGNRFNGDVAPAIMDLVSSGTIRVVDLLFVSKGADGSVVTLDVRDLDAGSGAGYLSLDLAWPGALGDEDAEEVADDLPPDSSALLVAFENLWAVRFVEACRESHGVVIDQIRIPADVVRAVAAGEPAHAVTS